MVMNIHSVKKIVMLACNYASIPSSLFGCLWHGTALGLKVYKS